MGNIMDRNKEEMTTNKPIYNDAEKVVKEKLIDGMGQADRGFEDFKRELIDFSEKIKKSTEEELPEIKKYLTKLLDLDDGESFINGKNIEKGKHFVEKELDKLYHASDCCISNHPWKSMAIASLIGCFIGSAMHNKKHKK